MPYRAATVFILDVSIPSASMGFLALWQESVILDGEVRVTNRQNNTGDVEPTHLGYIHLIREKFTACVKVSTPLGEWISLSPITLWGTSCH